MTQSKLQINAITFGMGMDNTNSPSDVGDGYIVDGLNKQLVGSDLRDRLGAVKQNSVTVGAVRCIGLFDVAIAGTHYAMSMWTDGKIYTGTSTLTEIGTSFDTTATTRWGCVVLQDGGADPYAIIANGVEKAYKWNPGKNGGDVSALSANITSTERHPLVFGDRLWLYNGLNGYWSALLDCTDFTAIAADFHIFPDDGSTAMLGGFVYKGSLYSCSESNIHRTDYTGDATTPFTHEGEYVVRGHSYYPDTVAEVEGYIIAYATDGHFYIFDGVNERRIGKLIDAYVTDISEGRRIYYRGVFHPVTKEYIFATDLVTAGQNETILVANMEQGIVQPRWNTKWTGVPMHSNVLCVYNNSGVMTLLSGTSDATGFLYQINSGSNDDGSPINAWCDTKQYSWGTSLLEKNFKAFKLEYSGVLNTFFLDLQIMESGNSYPVDIEQEGDYLAAATETDDDFWLGDDVNPGSWLVGEDEVFDTYTHMNYERDFTFQVKLTSQGYNETAEIRRLLVKWLPQTYR